MPFDPDKYLAEKQGAQADAPQTGGGFDPDAYLQSKGIQTLPNQGQVQDGATAANAYNKVTQVAKNIGQGMLQGAMSNGAVNAVQNAATQGMSLGGLGRDLSPFVSAAFPTVTDEAMGRDYGDRVLASKAEMDQDAAQSAKDYPTLSKVTNFISAIPKTIALTGVLSKIGLNGLGSQGAIQGALGGLTSANKEKGYANLAEKAGTDAAIGYGLGNLTEGLADKFAKVVSSGNQTVNALGEKIGQDAVVDPINPNRVGVKVTPLGNDAFDIKYQGLGKQASTAAQLSSEEGKFLSDPELRAKVADKVANVFGSDENPGQIPQLIAKTKDNLGQIRDGILKDQGSVATDIEDSMKSAYDGQKTIDAGGNDQISKASDDLAQRLQTIEGNLRAKSPTGSLNDVPLRDVFLQKQALGEALFGKNQLYRNAGPVRSQAIDLWKNLGGDVSEADPTGKVKTLTDGFSALYRMEDNSINKAATLTKAFESPDAAQQRLAYKDFITPFTKFDPGNRAAMMPELQNFLAYDLPATMNAKAVVDAANHSVESTGGIGWVLNKLYMNKSSALQAAGGLSALSSKASNFANAIQPSPQTLQQLGNGLANLPQTLSNIGK